MTLRVCSCARVLTTRLGPPALRWVSSPILHVQVSTLTESRGLQVKSDFWKHWPPTGRARLKEQNRGGAPGEMVKRTGRCVSLSLRDGVHAVLRLDIVTHTESPSAKKEKKKSLGVV